MEKREQGFALYINGANFASGNSTLPTRTKRGLDADLSYSPKDKSVLMTRTRETAGETRLFIFHLLSSFYFPLSSSLFLLSWHPHQLTSLSSSFSLFL